MAEPGRELDVSVRHRIVAATVLVAALAGAAVGLADFPWHAGASQPTRREAERRAVVAAAFLPQRPPAATAAAATKPPRIAGHGAAKPRAPRPREVAPHPPAGQRTTIARRVERQDGSVERQNGSVDARYAQDVARYCAPGLAGLVCRETVKWRLCSGRWNRRPEPDARRCCVEEERCSGLAATG